MSQVIKFTDLPARPGFGKAGRPIKVWTNFYPVEIPNAIVHHYDVDIQPDVPAVLSRQIFAHFQVTERGGVLGGVRGVYDGRRNVYTIGEYPFGDYISHDIPFPSNDSNRPPRQFKIKLKKVAQKNLEELLRFVEGRSSRDNVATGISALEVLINQAPAMNFITIGRRAFFTREGAMPITGGLEVYQGYWQSLRPGQGGYYINFDTVATAFYQSENVATLFAKLLGCQRVEELRGNISPQDRSKLERSLRRLKFRVLHRGDNFTQKFRIHKLSEKAASEDSEASTTITVQNYFIQHYNRRLQYPFLPCIQLQSGSYFPAELCVLEEGQRYEKKLSDDQTADMIKFTCQKPHVRKDRIQKGIDSFSYDQNQTCRDWGLRVSRQMKQVEARVLPAPRLAYHPSGKEANFVPQMGAWQLGPGKKMLVGATLESWSVLIFANQHSIRQQMVDEFIRELANTLSENGANIVDRQPPSRYTNPNGNIEESIRIAFQAAKNHYKKAPQLILCILQSKTQIYDEIKRIEDTVSGVLTSCAIISHRKKRNKQYYGMLGLKINKKLGGTNMSLQKGFLPFFENAPTIVFGADVTHPGRLEKTPSIAAVVGSTSLIPNDFATSIRFQASRTEIIDKLKDMVQELLKAFYKKTGKKPERILFYRDGVSEGQFDDVKDHEVEAIRKACLAIEKTYKPKLTFIIVQKRHHARFFPMNKNDEDRSGNCTVVEKTITHPLENDFYLQSHSGIQGTSRPTHYHILEDENKFTPDGLQTLTYNLCYLYVRCPRAVSMVPPAYYAHLAAFRARSWIKQLVVDANANNDEVSLEDCPSLKADLQKTMFYI
ncbi:3079_t:CDS:10 [Ambispora leptoticha]|uniref:3079_t:CDS:1 n=1 Tax=Ambispora leptoticha TaxID=144679 RepID=A0A9N8W3S7_9GLOM|nr:3079_t:CDS:10 [Ambispora leptoticha]